MKDSGIEWIGQIPEDWETIKLKSIVDYNTDTLAENTEADYEFDYIEIGSVEFGKGIVGAERLKFKDAPSRARRIVKKDDVILSTVRTYLKAVAQIPEHDIQMIASTGFIILTAKNEYITPEYLYYSILSSNFISLVEANSVGISYPAINSSLLVNYKITYPSIDEQKEISDYLDNKCSEIDKLITKKEQLIEELETYKKSLIYEYVTGKKEVI
jgi:type I restriction enzyme S subunit